MNREPLTSDDSAYSETPCLSSHVPSHTRQAEPHYFDRPGLAWIAACVLFSSAAGRWLPQAVEPGGMHAALVAMGVRAAEPVQVASLPQPLAANPAAPTASAERAFVASVFRQY